VVLLRLTLAHREAYRKIHFAAMKRAARVHAPELAVSRNRAGASRQLADQFRSAIGSGLLPVGARLPATRRLAAALGISRNTVLAAYDDLLADGLISGRVGDGSYVASGIRRRSFADPDGNQHTLSSGPPTPAERGWQTSEPRAARR
jgi:DNA-binding transcriptional MocR family regulator